MMKLIIVVLILVENFVNSRLFGVCVCPSNKTNVKIHSIHGTNYSISLVYMSFSRGPTNPSNLSEQNVYVSSNNRYKIQKYSILEGLKS